jgi:hypothetical protein
VFTATSRESPKTKAEGTSGRPRSKIETPDRVQANPLWHQLATRVQAKLTVSSPDEPYEREADRVADQVMRMPEPVVQRACPACAAGGLPCPKCQEEKVFAIHRKADGSGDIAGASVPEGFLSNLGPGCPLDATTRTFIEPRFGQDFSRVRVHTDARAAESARAVDARAYTLGSDIVFDAGNFNPGTPRGRRLLAHELTHVVQQQHARVPAAQAVQFSVSAPYDRAEREADRVAEVVTRAGTAPPIVERPTATLARATFDVDTIVKDTDDLANQPVPIGASAIQMSVLFFKVNGHATGDLAMAADYPTTFTLPADKSKRVPTGKLPKADPTPPLSNIPVEAHLFPSLWPTPRRALVLGGFHGDEQPGWQATDALVQELSKGGDQSGLPHHRRPARERGRDRRRAGRRQDVAQPLQPTIGRPQPKLPDRKKAEGHRLPKHRWGADPARGAGRDGHRYQVQTGPDRQHACHLGPEERRHLRRSQSGRGRDRACARHGEHRRQRAGQTGQ